MGVKPAPEITPTLNVPLTAPQPATVPLKVNWVVTVGDAVVTNWLEVLRPVVGVQLMPVAFTALAVSTTEPPASQISPLAGSDVISGRTV